jgi:hypothetical protein
MLAPFPRLARWHEANADKLPSLNEYLESIAFNLESARVADRAARRPGATSAFHIEEGKVLLLSSDPSTVVRAGDWAIRSSISALELGLQVVNYAVGIGSDKKNVGWSHSRGGPGAFRRAVVKMCGDTGDIAPAIDRIFDSHRFGLFKNYRNWITHCGAPKALSSIAIGSVPVIAELSVGESPSVERTVEAANEYVLERMRVATVPFVPSLHGLIDDEKGTRPPGAPPGLIFKNNYVVVGDTFLSEAAYRKANPVELGTEYIEVAGEKLTVYPARAYLFAIQDATMFAAACFHADWDQALVRWCELSAA